MPIPFSGSAMFLTSLSMCFGVARVGKTPSRTKKGAGFLFGGTDRKGQGENMLHDEKSLHRKRVFGASS